MTATGLAIGIDIGGTKIAAGLVRRADGTVLAREQLATGAGRGGKAVLDDVLALAGRLQSQAAAGAGREAGAPREAGTPREAGAARHAGAIPMGIGICELVDTAGALASHGLIDWRGLDADRGLAAIAPFRFESDARAPAMAEAHFGAGRPYDSFLYLTLGTGISHCLMLAGAPWRGARGNAIVAASGPLGVRCPECGTVQQSSLESIAAGPAIVANYNREARQALNREAGQPVSHGAEVSAAAARGDPLAIKVLETAASDIAATLAALVNALDPAAVVLGGGLGLAGGVFHERLVAATRGGIWAEATRALPILPAALGADAGIVGAALCAPE